MTTTKSYPRAKVRPVVNGWAVDLLLKAGAKPIKVNATYATMDFAWKAALVKLGVKPHAAALTKVASPLQQEWKQGPGRTPAPAKVADTSPTGRARRKDALADPGTCNTCKRPMRPVGTLAADHPGTTLRQRDGLCQSCNRAQTRAVA